MRKYKALPNVLKGVRQWVVYGGQGKGIPLKKPYNPNGQPAKVDNPKTWGTFQDCEKAVASGKYCGLGYVFTGDYIVIDMDSVIDAKGHVLPIAQEIIDALDSYTEISRSKRGVHIIIKQSTLQIMKNRAPLPVKTTELDRYKRTELDRSTGKYKEKIPEIEIYTTGRYVILTGDVVGGRKIIKDGSQALKKVYNAYIDPKDAPKIAPKEKKPTKTREAEPLDAQEEQLLQIAFRGKNGDKIKALWQGITTGYASQSEADLALCNYLAFYTNKNADLMDKLFCKSGLYRDKWEKESNGQTYGQKTIQTAINNFKGRTLATYKQKSPK
jgi:putative DNA primase/helicase